MLPMGWLQIRYPFTSMRSRGATGGATTRLRILTSILAPILIPLVLILSLAQGVSADQGISYEVKVHAKRLDRLTVRMVLRSSTGKGFGDNTIRLSRVQGNEHPGRSGPRFTRTIQNFQVRSPRGDIPCEKSGALYWTLRPQGARVVTVTYDVTQIVTGRDKNLALLFDPADSLLYWIGHEDMPARIRFLLPSGWKAACSLRPGKSTGKSPTTFTAARVKELLDCPALLGRLHRTDFKVQGILFSLVFHERPKFEPHTMASRLKKIAQYMFGTFGVKPFDRYCFLVLFSEGWRGGRTSHHFNTSVSSISARMGDWQHPRMLMPFAQNLCRAWNGRFIHPKGRDRSPITGPSRTRARWFTRGISDYYACRSLLKTGLMKPEDFFHHSSRHLGGIETSGEYTKSSIARISWAAGERDRGFFPSPLSCTSYGHLLGLILDLDIRHTTRGKRSLDDVMKLLGWWFGKKNTGYDDNTDLEKAVSSVAKQDYSGFFSSHVEGAEAVPIESALALIGYEVSRKDDAPPSCFRFVRHLSKIGLQVKTGRIENLDPTSCLYAAGIRVDDRIQTILGVNLREVRNLDGLSRALFGKWRGCRRKGGMSDLKEIPVIVKRGGKSLKVSVKPPASSRGTVLFSPKSGKYPLRAAYLKRWFPPPGGGRKPHREPNRR